MGGVILRRYTYVRRNGRKQRGTFLLTDLDFSDTEVSNAEGPLTDLDFSDTEVSNAEAPLTDLDFSDTEVSNAEASSQVISMIFYMY